MAKASLGIALIAKNAEKTIGACLDSIVPYVEQVVVCVDTNTTDHTAQVARDHGAEVHEGHQVSFPHECEYHGKIMAQHFADARQAAWAYLRPDLAWHGWIDADDVLQGGEKLAEYLTNMPDEIDVVWLQYNYAQVEEGGPTTTIFDRERLVRTRHQWAWKHRVHEILAPVGKSIEHMVNTRTNSIVVVHQTHGHNTEGSARRNITLLEIDLEENENDVRSWFYLGNQYFALSDWRTAADHYEKASQLTDNNVYQLWQTLIYLSMCYEHLGDLDGSRSAAFRAIHVQPSHSDPYYRLATAYAMTGDVERAEFWKSFGDKLPDPPNFVFKNPMEKHFNAHLVMASAYANVGMISKARRELEFAAKASPQQTVLESLEYHRQLEKDIKTADAYVEVLSNCKLDITRHSPIDIPDGVWRVGRVRDIVAPNIIARRSFTQPRVVFFCGRSSEQWSPDSLNTTGIGGSETAVVKIAERFARDNWRVDVYNDCDRLEGEYEGVGYWDCKRLQEGEHADVFVSWRQPKAHNFPPNHRVSLLWCHDLNYGAGTRDSFSAWTKVLGVSAWHAAYLSQLYGRASIGYVPNGIELARFDKQVKRVPFRCVYTSSPDRGLERLLDLWPRVIEQEPTAELHIAYGWENIDKVVAMGHQHLGAFKQYMIHKMEKLPGVKWLGRLPQDKLAELYLSSTAWLYPADFLEVFCIGAVEAMAAGCVVVTSGVGALPETVGDGGLVVTGNVYTRAWRDYYTHIARGVIHTPNIRAEYMKAGRLRAEQLTWDNAYLHWKGVVMPLLEKKELVTV